VRLDAAPPGLSVESCLEFLLVAETAVEPDGLTSDGAVRYSSAFKQHLRMAWLQVVPHFGGVLRMMSPGRSAKLSQMRVSVTGPT